MIGVAIVRESHRQFYTHTHTHTQTLHIHVGVAHIVATTFIWFLTASIASVSYMLYAFWVYIGAILGSVRTICLRGYLGPPWGWEFWGLDLIITTHHPSKCKNRSRLTPVQRKRSLECRPSRGSIGETLELFGFTLEPYWALSGPSWSHFGRS